MDSRERSSFLSVSFSDPHAHYTITYGKSSCVRMSRREELDFCEPVDMDRWNAVLDGQTLGKDDEGA